MLRNFVMTLTCLGAGVAPVIAEETAKMEEAWVLTSSQMDGITAGNTASVIQRARGLKAVAQYQDANTSFSSSMAEVLQTVVSDGSGGTRIVLTFNGFAETPATIVSPSPEPPEPPVEPGYTNRAAQVLSQLLGR